MNIECREPKRVKAKKGDPQRTIRFPREIIDQLIRDAVQNGRSINSEVVYRIAKGLDFSLKGK